MVQVINAIVTPSVVVFIIVSPSLCLCELVVAGIS